MSNLGYGGATYDAKFIHAVAASSTPGGFVVGTSAAEISPGGHIQIIHPLILGTNGLSFAFWFAAYSYDGGARAFEFGNQLPEFCDSHDNIYFGEVERKATAGITTTGGDSTLFSDVLNGIMINDYQWRHVAWTIDPKGYWVIYLNGAQVWSNSNAGYPSTVELSHNYIGYGGYIQRIDEFYLFETVISAGKVQELYSQKFLDTDYTNNREMAREP